MKKIVLALCLCVFLVAGMCACTNDNEVKPDATATSDLATTADPVETTAPVVETTEDVVETVEPAVETTVEPTPVETGKEG